MTSNESTAAHDEKSAQESMETSRIEVMECEKEIQSIKNSLRSLPLNNGGSSGIGGSGWSEDANKNSLKVAVHKVSSSNDSTESSVSPDTFKINLSSPIEERTITKLHDPLDPSADGSFVIFEQVEISNALLTIEAYLSSSNENADNGAESLNRHKVGVSAAHDLLPLVEGLNSLMENGDEKKSLLLEVAIVSEGDGEAIQTIVVDEKIVTESAEDKGTEEKVEVESKAKEGGENAEADKSAESAEKNETPENGAEEAKESAVEEGEKEVVDESKARTDEKETSEEVPKESEASETSEPKDDTGTSTTANATESTEHTNTTTSNVQLPLCTLTIHLEYTPSPADKRDALYDKLNEVSKRKAAAIERLRQSATAVNRAKASDPSTTSILFQEKSPAVKSGFLNKAKPDGTAGAGALAADAKHAPPFWKRWYEKTIGPSSLLWMVGPIAKNYIIFFGCAALFHYKGDLLALPLSE